MEYNILQKNKEKSLGLTYDGPSQKAGHRGWDSTSVSVRVHVCWSDTLQNISSTSGWISMKHLDIIC